MNPAPVLRHIREDFAVTPGRLHGSIEITLQVMLLAAIAMTIQLPEAALAAYLLFFAHKDNAGESMTTALMLLVAVTAAVPLALLLLGAVVDHQMARILAMAGFTFVGMFLAHASRLGPLAGTVGFVFAFALTLFDIIPIPELLNRALEWIWVVVALPMGLMAIWAALAGPRPDAKARERIAEWRAASARPDSDEARALLDEGLDPFDTYLAHAQRLGEISKKDARLLALIGDNAYFNLALAEAGAFSHRSAGAPPPVKEPFLAADAFSNPEHWQFAAKVLLAVVATYIFYTAFGGFQIHTAMITAFYVTLDTRGETHQKITLRLIGALMGMLVGAMVVLLLMPHMTDLGHLLAVVGIVTFAAAWISLGGARIAYAGWQMALCFYLVAMNSFTPTLDFAAAIDRIAGILVGSLVVWAVFSALWPVSARDKAAEAMEEFERGMANNPPPATGREVWALRMPLAKAAQLAHAHEYELGGGDAPDPEAGLARLHALLKGEADAIFTY
ncbi:MAG: FUSC family protein [Maritimibacter sp.]